MTRSLRYATRALRTGAKEKAVTLRGGMTGRGKTRGQSARRAPTRTTREGAGAICTVFALVATVLAGIGLYAVILQAVSQRTQEIGLRIALGATRRDIVALVFTQGIRPLVPGLAIGLLLAFGLTRVLRSLLMGVSPNDPVTFVGTVAVLLLAAAIGCVVPARKAMKVDPLVALRCE